MDSFNRLVEIMTRLRAPDGCPWDREQTHESLRAYLIEESAEVLEAIENARQQTRVLTRRLEALGLLTAFDAVAMPSKGKPLRLQGLFRVDEEKLQQISARDLRTLLRKGELRAVHAHLLSLENFSRLLDLSVG